MVSVIIPVYNAEESLRKILICLENQIYKEFEVILVDDGSKDQSAAICDEYSEKDKRFKVIHQVNRGVSAARNNGMSEAKGEYITFLDADDEIPNNYLEELVFTQQRTEVDVVVCDVAIIQNGEEIRRFTYATSMIEKNQALNLLFSRKQINSGPCAKLFSKKILYKLQFPILKAYEDILFVKNVFDRVEKIAVTNQTEYRYIQHTDSTMHQFAQIPSNDVIVATGELVKYIKRKNELSSECMYITLSHLFQYVQPILKNKDKMTLEFINQVRKLYRQYWVNILACDAFPWKEKVLFIAFAFGMYR